MKKFLYRLVLSLSFGFLLYLAWPPRVHAWLAFVGLLPLLVLDKNLEKDKGWKFFLWIYFANLFWNYITLWWVSKADVGGATFMVLANSLLYSFPWWMKRWSAKLFGVGKSFLVFISAWCAIEYMHFNWDVAYPWINLGNLFAIQTDWVQWYEYTGIIGGSLWVLYVNYLLFKLGTGQGKLMGFKAAFWILVPLGISYWVTPNQEPQQNQTALIIQPNIDPYSDKFSKDKIDAHFQMFLEMMEQNYTPDVDIIVFPETALAKGIDENYIQQDAQVQQLKQWSAQHNNVPILAGADSYKIFEKDEPLSLTARKFRSGNSERYYDSYNTAIWLVGNQKPQVYHKAKLVPGVEKMPYPKYLGFLESLAIDMGGTTGSLGTSEKAGIFRNNELSIAPLICYESVFGAYAGEFVKEGAQVLGVVTNDGWWSNTDGYKQHLYYSKLLAVSLRREVLRSANTGISGKINIKGELTHQTEWWENTVLKVNFGLTSNLTFYAKYGDLLGKVFSFFTVFFGLGLIVKRCVRK